MLDPIKVQMWLSARDLASLVHWLSSRGLLVQKKEKGRHLLSRTLGAVLTAFRKTERKHLYLYGSTYESLAYLEGMNFNIAGWLNENTIEGQRLLTALSNEGIDPKFVCLSRALPKITPEHRKRLQKMSPLNPPLGGDMKGARPEVASSELVDSAELDPDLASLLDLTTGLSPNEDSAPQEADEPLPIEEGAVNSSDLE